jgi:hypothetical protein
MRLSKLNDYIQTLATIGAIAGLILVAFEIRQSSRIAMAQSISTSLIAQSEGIMASIDTEVTATLVKSITNPEDLTTTEKMNLSFYFGGLALRVNNEYAQIVALDIEVEDSLKSFEEMLEGAASGFFPGRWARAWFHENKMFWPPQAAAAIERGLKKTDPNSQLETFERIDERAAATG